MIKVKDLEMEGYPELNGWGQYNHIQRGREGEKERRVGAAWSSGREAEET
jgi:hypothetical protein